MAAILIVVVLGFESDEFLTPAESLARIKLPPGYVAELVACEPNIQSPVAISFDERGRMFVAEYRDYPQGPTKGEPPLSRIRLLEDHDGDGFFETATIFADHLNFAQGVLAINGGVIVTAAPDIFFLKDTDGDGVADEKKVLFTGFKAGNPQLRVSHPRLAIDNMVYVSNGLSGGEIHHVAAKGPIVPLMRDDFRFDPKTMIGEATTGFGQFGNTFDDWGRRFTCSNRNPIMHSYLPKRVLNRNDQIPIAVGYADVAPSGGDTRVYPIARTQTTAESHAGTHTAACGVWVYRGDLCPEMHGDVFVCEPTGYLVTRSKLETFSSGFRTERDRPNEDFLTSSDTWFRPVSLADGPDGALYVVDMHREVVEHPDYLPKGVGANYRFRAGADKGRIIRIKPKDAKPRPFKAPRTTAEAVALLWDENGWRRDLGQRLLVERGTKEAVPELRAMLQRWNDTPVPHAFWTLRALNALTFSDLEFRLKHNVPSPLVEIAMEAGEPILIRDRRAQDLVLRRIIDSHPRVTMVATLKLGDFDHPKKLDALVRALLFDPDLWVRQAVYSSCANLEGSLFDRCAVHPGFEDPTDDQLEILSRLAAAAVHRDELQLRSVLRRVGAKGQTRQLKWAGLLGLAEGFQKANPWKANSLADFLRSPPTTMRAEVNELLPALDAAQKTAFDRKEPVEQRTPAIRLVGVNPASAPELVSLIDPAEPAIIQLTAIASVHGAGTTGAVDRLIVLWSSLSPTVQEAAVGFCFRRRDSQMQFLQAIAAGKVPASAVGAERREMMLVFSSDQEIKALAQKLFGATSSNRAALIEQYLPTAKRTGDAAKGKEVFQRVCANCHRLKGLGVAVGPELADVRQKSTETLLTDILDPNRTVEPRYVSYVAALTDGRTIAGLLTSESSGAVVLKLPSGKEETILRDQIERLRSTGRSLMPEGVEKDVTAAQMADLLAFVTSPN